MTVSGIVKSAGVASLWIVVALGLAGCGRRGDLEIPGAAAKTASAPAGRLIARPKSATKPVAPKKSFLLDPLL